MTVPSLEGVTPKSLSRIAFSIAFSVVLSHGSMTSIWASGVFTPAIWFTGVGTP